VNTKDVFAERARWLKTAADGGDLVAKLMLRQLESPTAATITAFEAELKSALNSGDPAAIWEAGRAISLAGFGWTSLSKKPWPGKEFESLRAVFQLAACELGYPCGYDSNLMTSFCIRGTCAPRSYAEWLPTFLSSEQHQVVRAELERVVRELKAKRGANLIFH
jgi:hypothetical protein